MGKGLSPNQFWGFKLLGNQPQRAEPRRQLGKRTAAGRGASLDLGPLDLVFGPRVPGGCAHTCLDHGFEIQNKEPEIPK